MAPAFGSPVPFLGNDKSLFGIILGVVTFWLFAQTTLNIAPGMGKDLGLDASTMNVAGDRRRGAARTPALHAVGRIGYDDVAVDDNVVAAAR